MCSFFTMHHFYIIFQNLWLCKVRWQNGDMNVIPLRNFVCHKYSCGCYLILQINNPDMRVKIIKEFVMESFPAKPLLNYALEVEKITTSKKPNLILNVDGVIAVSFVDLLRHSGSFTRYVAF